ncbi:MAG: DUF1016 family protein [Verrucomicrobia bacterium]|jgi:predicted nuclease of restriction endonuclease-like (RecB) superfamily|nr:DUF1016 family protein [Verrucomicrobiota bacterium]
MNYDALISSIADTHSQTQIGAAQAVNRQLIARNWLTGAYLIEFEQNGEDRAQYGAKLIPRVAEDLKIQGVPGLGASMLKNCRTLYRVYPQIRQSAIGVLPPDSLPQIRQSPIGEFEGEEVPSPLPETPLNHPDPLPASAVLRLSWTHLIELIRIEDPWKRAFYENECLKGNWSVRQLQRQIGSLLYERTALSTDKETVIQAGRNQAGEVPLAMDSLIRDPYVLEFAGLAERPHYLESDLEKALLDHLQAFLLELGNGFCFEARQKRVSVGNEHDYIDLVFYHRKLRSHLLVDLKIRAFQHGDAGQMNYYLNYWKDQMMEPDDNLPVGLILCADRDQTKAQYATSGMDQQLFVSRYLTKLPSPDEIRELIESDQAVFEEQAPYNLQPEHCRK